MKMIHLFKMKMIDINNAMSVCLRNGVRVYPVVVGRSFKIEVDNNGKKIRYDKLLNKNNVASAQSKTYKHWALIIKQKEKENAAIA